MWGQVAYPDFLDLLSLSFLLKHPYCTCNHIGSHQFRIQHFVVVFGLDVGLLGRDNNAVVLAVEDGPKFLVLPLGWVVTRKGNGMLVHVSKGI